MIALPHLTSFHDYPRLERMNSQEDAFGDQVCWAVFVARAATMYRKYSRQTVDPMIDCTAGFFLVPNSTADESIPPTFKNACLGHLRPADQSKFHRVLSQSFPPLNVHLNIR